MLRKFFYAGIFFAVFPLYAAELSWDDCVSIALEKSPGLISARAALDRARANNWASITSALPSVSASASASKSGSEPAPGTIREAGGMEFPASNSYSTSYSYGISGRQLLFDSFKTWQDMERAGEDLKSARLNYTQASASVRFRLKQAHVELIKAQELVSMSAEIMERRKSQVRDIELRYSAGREHRGSLMSAEASLMQAEFEYLRAKRGLELAKEALANALGVEYNAEISAGGEFKPVIDPSTEPDFEALFNDNPAIMILTAQRRAAELSAGASISSFFPSVNLNGSVSRRGDVFLPEDTGWSVGLNVSLPLFDSGLLLARSRAAHASLRQAEADLISGASSAKTGLKRAWDDFTDANTALNIQEKLLEASIERANIADAQYSNGLLSFDNWTIIQDSLVNARKSRLNSAANLLITEAAWIQAKGGTLEDEKK
ncbi:MAG TPA: TolC family protein [bacterium]|nr:TolC family protein [bacterium]